MIPEILELRDFLSYARPPALDLRGLRLACLSGPNGHGKSSLLDALTWALWGRARGCEGGQRQDRLIADGGARADVRLTFRMGTDRYRVRRWRDRRGRSGLTLEVAVGESWRDISAVTQVETDALIGRVLGMDYHSFVHSAYLVQGQAGAFADLTPAKRRELLARVLGADTYRALADEARDRQRAAEARLAAAEARRDAAATRAAACAVGPSEMAAADAAVEAADSELVAAQEAVEVARSLAARIEALNARQADVEAELVRIKAEAARLPDASERSRLERAVARLAEIDRELGAHDDDGAARLDEAEGELADVKARLAEVEATARARLRAAHAAHGEAGEAAARLRARRDADCPTCGEPIGPRALTRFEAAATAAAAALAHLESEASMIGTGERDKVEALTAEVTRLRRALAARRRLEDERASLVTAPARLAHLDDALLQQAALAEAQAAARRRQDTLSGERAELAGVDPRGLDARVRAAVSRRDGAREHLTLLRQRRSDHSAAIEAADAAAAEARESAAEADAYRHLVAAFGRQGIPARLIDAAIPEIQADANALLERLTDGALAITLETRRETQRGSVADTLEVAVWAGDSPRDIALLSGGEAFRVSVALRIALSRLLARRAGRPLELLVVDEGLGSQDAEGRARMVDALHRVAGEFTLVLLVTHLDEVKDLFSERIEVAKAAAGGSVARVITG